MYDHHEDAVQISFYHDWNKQDGSGYYLVPLCDGCAAAREGNVGEAGDPDHGVGWRCEDCDRPNQAQLELEDVEHDC